MKTPKPYQSPLTINDARQPSPRPKYTVESLFLFAVAGSLSPFPLIVWSGETEPFFGPFFWPHAVISSIGGVIGLGWIGWYAFIYLAVYRGWLNRSALSLALVAVIFGGLSFFVPYMYLADRSAWNSGSVN